MALVLELMIPPQTVAERPACDGVVPAVWPFLSLPTGYAPRGAD